MINKISHLGIAVKDLKSASEMYRKLLNSEPSEMEYVAEQMVNVVKFTVGESTIELLEGTSADSPISKFIEKRGEGIHHIAYEVADIRAEMMRLKAEGFSLLNEEPKRGADNKLVCFIHPRSTNGVLIELTQEIR